MPTSPSTVIRNCSDPVSEERTVSLCGAGPDLRLVATLALVRDKCISTGKAAELTGRSKVEIIDELDRRGLPYFTETPAELAAQVAASREQIGKEDF